MHFVLAAVILSYLFEIESYLPLFMFPPMIAGRTVGDNLQSDVYLSNLLGNDTSVLINNAWARMGLRIFDSGWIESQPKKLSFDSQRYKDH
jgi:hypothetical protein